MDVSFKLALRKWCELLELHGGRDKVIRITGYIFTFISDSPTIRSLPVSQKLRIIGRQLSLCRTVLRLFDDLPMLNRSLSYGLGSNEKDLIMRFSMLLSNSINHCYYPLEHIAWLGDQGVLPVKSAPYWKGVAICWTSTMYLALVRTVRTISLMVRHRHQILKARSMTDEEIAKFYRGIIQELLTLLQQLSDFGIAVNLIPGFLWGGQLKPRHTGLLGIISSAIMILKLLRLVP